MAMFARLLASIGLILLTTSASAQELPHAPGELIAKMAEGADLAQLDALLAHFEAPECRGRLLVDYFGAGSGACGRCDLFLHPGEKVGGTAGRETALTAG